jgi:hypothetical protein
MIELKGGAVTADPRLDRVVLFDEASRDYPIMEAPVVRRAKAPRSYTWSLGTTLDQGSEGACVGFGWAHELLARPAVVSGIDNRAARERLYWEIQRRDPWPGGAYPGASPFYEGTAVLTGAQYAHGLGAMAEYRWSFSLAELVMAIGYAGPAVLGLNWYEGMFEPDERGYIRPTGSLAGGHCIVARGVSLKYGYVLLHNSWGASWGKNGTCLISFNDLDRLLHEQGEACIPVRRNAQFVLAA